MSDLLHRSAPMRDPPSMDGSPRAKRGCRDGFGNVSCAQRGEEAVPGRRFTPEAMLRDAFAPEPRFILLVAERAGAVVGYALATPSYESNWAAPGLCVGDIYVAPSARRWGVARALVAELAAPARREGREQ